jgi:serralysin
VRFTTAESLISIENARGSDFGDTIFGDSNANRIDGLGGDDSIDGDPGNDTISGGPGTNTLFGNTGVDTLVINGTITSKTRLSATEIRVIGTTGGIAFDDRASGFEQVLENGVLKSIAFFMGETATNNVQQTVIAETSVVAKINALVAGQTLNGNGNANTISGEAGSDDIAGLGGNDTLNGRGGDDCLFGGTGVDRLNGGTGDDTLDGGPGLDNLTGGPGKDTFVFSSALANSSDVITDYTVADDTILISKSLVGNLPAGSLAANRFKNTALGNISSEDRIIYESATGKLFFDSNGSGVGGRVLIATLPAGLAMVAGEIKIQ